MSRITIAGGRIICLQCNARSKHTQQQCRSPAMRGKSKCRVHGGKSTGPKTTEGRERCAVAKTIHGHETRAKRAESSRVLAQLADLEAIGYSIGMFRGPRTRGRRAGRG